ncbi:MAG: acyl-CoA dehydrogenase family protein [Rhodospirillaceae bacterium]
MDTGAFQLPADVVEMCGVAKRIVQDELLPLESQYLQHPDHSFGTNQTSTNLRLVFGQAVLDRLTKISRDTGLWYLMVPEQHGGSGLSMLAQIAILEQFNYTAVPFPFAHVANILYQCEGDQVDRFLKPVIEGEKITSFAQTEANAGSDPGGMMQTSAVQDGNEWVLNGTKMWISGAAESDVIMVQAVTDKEKRQRGGVTMFLVDRNNPGVTVEEPGIQTWLGNRPSQYIVHFENCRISSKDILGDVGNGFRLGQRWLTIHDRLLRGPFALGKMQRALDMSIEWAKQRETFGKLLSERQAIQWKLVDMYTDLQALQSMTYQMAARADTREDIRTEASMIKLVSMNWGARCVDHAIQIHGAMGESLELPLTLFYRYLRHGRIGGGTDEIQKMLIARKLLGD